MTTTALFGSTATAEAFYEFKVKVHLIIQHLEWHLFFAAAHGMLLYTERMNAGNRFFTAATLDPSNVRRTQMARQWTCPSTRARSCL